MRTHAVVSLWVALTLLVPACRKEPDSSSGGDAAPEDAMITLPVVRNLTYLGLEEEMAVTLDHGRWEGDAAMPGSASKPVVRLLRDYVLIGDVDGDDSEDGLVFLEGQSGGSGTNVYWALVQHRDGRIENTVLRRIGDRVQVRDARFEHDRIVLDMVQPGPDDALAFPGQLVTRIWQWVGGTWRERPNPNPSDRLTLGTLEGTRWRLRALNDSTRAPEAPEVTLSYENGRFSGRGGCNSYSAAVRAKQAPGEISVAPSVATRMACADSVMRVENRFFSLLPKVRRFGFAATELALEYEDGGARNGLYFTRVPSEGGLGQLPP